jgi:nucleosome binding factor SPN SPT16 subunit
MKNVGIFLKDDSEDEEEESEKENEPRREQILGRGKRTAVLDSKLRQDTSSEEKRKQHQKELATQLNEQARQRLSEQSSGRQSSKIRKSNVSYKNADQIPNEPEIKELKIFVGTRHFQ